MNDIGGISNQAILQQIGARQSEEEQDGGRTDFLQLLVAQLNNQDPLNPQEGGEFLAQLAQFSTVEGIERLNSSFDQFAGSQVSNQALQATALVGRSVQVNSSVGEYVPGQPLTGAIALPSSTSDLKLSVLNASGSLVREISLGSHAAGNVNFTWDGFDNNGQALPAGQYRVVAEAQINGDAEQVQARVNANVNSVTLGSNGQVILNLAGGLGSIPLSDVNQIN